MINKIQELMGLNKIYENGVSKKEIMTLMFKTAVIVCVLCVSFSYLVI